jgi:non-canonical purine NTP pyrophosphatase (RdgB/HAM1 family)
MNQLIFATTNQGKITEAAAILDIEIVPMSLELEEIQSLDFSEVIAHKAKQAFEKTQKPVLVEDSGIIFHALDKLPGVFTKWFYESIGNEGMVRLLHDFEDKSATAVSYVGYYTGKELIIAHGETSGTTVSLRGTQGFGWDPIFQPDGFKGTFAEMNPRTKNSCSMRKKALENLKQLSKDF